MTEMVQLIIFFTAFLADIINIPINNIFSICLGISIIGFAFFIHLIKDKARIKFLKKIDIFNYREEFDAL